MAAWTDVTWRLKLCQLGPLALAGHSTELFYIQKSSDIQWFEYRVYRVYACSGNLGWHGRSHVMPIDLAGTTTYSFRILYRNTSLCCLRLGSPLQVLQELGDTGPCLICRCDPPSDLLLDTLQRFSTLLKCWVPDDAGIFQTRTH